MAKFQITYLLDSDYCQVAPYDLVCQQSIYIDARSPEEASSKFPRSDLYDKQGNRLPIIWSIERVNS